MQPPGPRGNGGLYLGEDAHAIRGQPPLPGAIDVRAADVVRTRLQARLDARNSLLQQSLADHAERVAKRARAEGPKPCVDAADRLAAIRARVIARAAAAASSSATSGDPQSGIDSNVEHAAARVARQAVPAVLADDGRQLSA